MKAATKQRPSAANLAGKVFPHQASRAAASRVRTTTVADAKATLSSLLQEVQQQRTEITVMRRGVPVARIVPMAEPVPITGYGWMRGTVQELDDIVGPTGEEWDVSNESEA